MPALSPGRGQYEDDLNDWTEFYDELGEPSWHRCLWQALWRIRREEWVARRKALGMHMHYQLKTLGGLMRTSSYTAFRQKCKFRGRRTWMRESKGNQQERLNRNFPQRVALQRLEWRPQRVLAVHGPCDTYSWQMEVCRIAFVGLDRPWPWAPDMQVRLQVGADAELWAHPFLQRLWPLVSELRKEWQQQGGNVALVRLGPDLQVLSRERVARGWRGIWLGSKPAG